MKTALILVGGAMVLGSIGSCEIGLMSLGQNAFFGLIGSAMALIGIRRDVR